MVLSMYIILVLVLGWVCDGGNDVLFKCLEDLVMCVCIVIDMEKVM